MDENKEKELKKGEVPENDTLSAEEKKEVDEILENLKKSRNEAVTDWDGLAQVGAGNDEIIEEDDEIIEEDEDEKEEKPEKKSGKKSKKKEEEYDDDELCVACGKRKRYTEVDEDSLYCKVCREKMKKTPMNFWGVLSFIMAICAGIFAVVCSTYAISIAVPVIRGDNFAKSGKYYSAVSSYQEAILIAEKLNADMNQQSSQTATLEQPQTFFDAGKATYAKIIRTFHDMGSLLSAQDYVTQFEEFKALESFRYADIKEYSDLLSGFADTVSFINTRYQGVLSTLQYSSDTMKIEDIKPTLDELEALKKSPNHNKYAVAYMQSYMCSVIDGTEKYQIKYLEEIRQGGLEYEGMCLSQLCMLYLEEGNLAEVEKICNDALKAAPESIDYYEYLMKVKIRQGRPQDALEIYYQAEKAVALVYYPVDPTTGLGESYSIPYTLLTEKAVCHALLGQEAEALAAIDQSYAQGINIHNANVYALLHYVYHVKGTEPVYEENIKILDSVDNGYDTVVSVFETSSVEINKDVQAVINGEKTLEDVFVRGEVYLK
ncbi:MAG: hypothetical protein E7536_10200 [Ruminococcaceae bacterium]|nr:hypothetical protein [Oscillospiraceae bacterium]